MNHCPSPLSLRSLAVALAVLFAVCLHARAQTHVTDLRHYTLTPATLQKFRSIQKEAGDPMPRVLREAFKEMVNPRSSESKSGWKPSSDDDEESIKSFARELDANPKAKNALSKHGLTSTEYAVAWAAVAFAETYLMMEQLGVPKQYADEALSKFTKEERANLEVVRQGGPQRR